MQAKPTMPGPLAATATVCRKGHRLTPDNIMSRGSWRYCGICRREYGLAMAAWRNDPERRAAEDQYLAEDRARRAREREERREARRLGFQLLREARARGAK